MNCGGNAPSPGVLVFDLEFSSHANANASLFLEGCCHEFGEHTGRAASFGRIAAWLPPRIGGKPVFVLVNASFVKRQCRKVRLLTVTACEFRISW